MSAVKQRKPKSVKRVVSDTDNTDGEPEDSVEDAAKNADKPKEPVTLKKVLTRTVTALFLTGLYLSLLQAGHLYCILAVVITQIELYREIVNVRYVAAKEKLIPFFRTFQWSWFFIAMAFVYGDTFHHFCLEQKALAHLTVFTQHFRPASFVLYWVIFIASVLTLKPGLMRFQLSQYMWSIVSICMIVFQCKFFASNTLNGLFWFFFPMATVVMNDCSAYFCGISMGKKFIQAPFLALSPNKTWEGFLGAAVLTIIFSFFFPALLCQWQWFLCPAEGLYLWPFPPAITCEPNPVFIRTLINLPLIGPTLLYPIQLHGLVYGLFASLAAPFGGFFASAIKRAYRKKDFDSFMPGHGGMMDRMDCQLLMITFASFYYSFMIAPKAHSVQKMLHFTSLMTTENQQLLWQELGKQIAAGNTN